MYIAFWTCTVYTAYSNQIPIIRKYKQYLRGLDRIRIRSVPLASFYVALNDPYLTGSDTAYEYPVCVS